MRVGLLTEGGYPYATGEARVWCDRLVRGLAQHEFAVHALSRSERQEAHGLLELPPHVTRVRTAPLWGTAEDPQRDGLKGRTRARGYGRRERRRFAAHFTDLVAAVCGAAPEASPASAAEAPPAGGTQADRFASGLYGLAELAQEQGGLRSALRSEAAVRALETACRAPGALRGAHGAQLSDVLAVLEGLERALRPLSLDWYGEGDAGLGGVDLCHATSGGTAALPGLIAKRFYGIPLLVTEYGVRLREHYLASAAAPLTAPVRALLASFQRQLATEVYAQASLITPGNTHAYRWQERCGADRAKLRTVYPGMDARPFAAVGDADRTGEAGAAPDRMADDRTLVWVGRIEPAKDLVALLHAFRLVRESEPAARLRIVGAPGHGPEAAGYDAHCRVLAAQLFPDEAESAVSVGDNPVSFEGIGDPEVPELADAYAAATVVVQSSVVEGFPVGLVEAMLCGRATVSTDAGAVCEVIGGTGLVVPPRNPRALADACVTLLRDPDRRARLGAAARARALEIFTVEQNIAAFRGIYLELMSRCPVQREPADTGGEPQPFARPAEAHVPGRWARSGGARPGPGRDAGPGQMVLSHTPAWAADGPLRDDGRTAARHGAEPASADAGGAPAGAGPAQGAETGRAGAGPAVTGSDPVGAVAGAGAEPVGVGMPFTRHAPLREARA
ncbi:DUF3492 domain-containing protein [Streptomyces sp. NPDC048639]|uniref:DUF3492 domain-containing protein n=1 Tax=Streptomyces sp. NPDC048639 TaxID=3365581 RepID=UPI003719F595